MHEEHRQRLRQRFISEGLDSFAPHNVLELLLFYSIPRRDTNETAHRLIEKYGSLHAVFDADVDDLTAIEGIGEHSAVLLKLIPQVARRYMEETQQDVKRFNNYRLIGDYFVPRFVGVTSETVYLMLLDASYRLLSCNILFKGSVNSAHIRSRELIEKALSVRASMAVLAHNHPGGVAIPSASDIETTRQIYDVFGSIDVLLLEHFVVADNKYTPIIIRSLPSLTQFLGDEEKRLFYSDPECTDTAEVDAEEKV